MKNIFLSISFLAAVFNQAAAQDIHSLKLNNPVVIDGSPEDWPQPFNFYNGETKLQYRVANDSANIYVCFKVTDEPAQMKMMRAGISVWIDPKGKKKETTGINFPMRQERGSAGDAPKEQTEGRGQIPGQSFQKHDFNRFKAMAKSQQITLKLQGFAGVTDQVTGIENKFGILAAFNWDSLNILTIEYQIPIAAVLQHPFAPADTAKPLGLGFVVNAMEAGGNWGGHQHSEESDMSGGMNNNSTMNGGMGGMNGGMNRGGMGGMNGGGMNHNGNGYGGSNNYNENAQEHKVWSKLILHY